MKTKIPKLLPFFSLNLPFISTQISSGGGDITILRMSPQELPEVSSLHACVAVIFSSFTETIELSWLAFARLSQQPECDCPWHVLWYHKHFL
jgi:hypothetical protein